MRSRLQYEIFRRRENRKRSSVDRKSSPNEFVRPFRVRRILRFNAFDWKDPDFSNPATRYARWHALLNGHPEFILLNRRDCGKTDFFVFEPALFYAEVYEPWTSGMDLHESLLKIMVIPPATAVASVYAKVDLDDGEIAWAFGAAPERLYGVIQTFRGPRLWSKKYVSQVLGAFLARVVVKDGVPIAILVPIFADDAYVISFEKGGIPVLRLTTGLI